jgi:hypothetical protein
VAKLPEEFAGGVTIVSLFSLFWKNRVGLWDHVTICVCLYPPPIVASQRLGKNPFIVARQRLGKNPLLLLGNGSVKIPLSLLDNGSVETLPR